MAATQFEVIETVNNNNAEESETKIKRRKDGNPKWTRSNKQKGVSSLVYPIKNKERLINRTRSTNDMQLPETIFWLQLETIQHIVSLILLDSNGAIYWKIRLVSRKRKQRNLELYTLTT